MKLQIADVARSAGSEVAEIEFAEIRLRAQFRLIEPEAAEVWFVDAVFCFVVAVALIAVLIGPLVDALVALVAVRKFLVSDTIGLVNLVWDWSDGHMTDPGKVYVV